MNNSLIIIRKLTNFEKYFDFKGNMNFNEINNYFLLLVSILLAFGVTFMFIPTIIRMARYKKLFDEVDERKLHTEQIPRLGGVGFFAGLVISVLLFVNTSQFIGFGGFVAGLFILFFIGLKDDILVIAPLTKFIGQLTATVIVVYFGNTIITDLHGFFGFHEIHWILGFGITVFVFLVTINAFNFIDGVDGLSSSIGVVVSGAFGIWFVLVEQFDLAIISFALVASLLAFIRYNVFAPKSKIFMGDTGSMIIGFVVSFLAVNFNELNIETTKDSAFFILPAPAVAFGVLIIPYFDMLRVMYIRLLKGQKVFHPDKNHLHHLLLRIGLTHKQVVASLVLFNIVFIGIVYYLSSFVTIRRLLLLEMLIALGVSFIPEAIVKRKEKRL
ncbi:MAG: undecaprenyl/decaprenyl-phosphate alpha-N-acetylglucosaminyl 1-phosphate transferase [Bacteroidales bacterium]|nr:undecaprenyl/decaprenyl-phosphate alpha-N-acetylglucosaminyl 1-phosphate transferase [Bacteroidales bacterium]